MEKIPGKYPLLSNDNFNGHYFANYSGSGVNEVHNSTKKA